MTDHLAAAVRDLRPHAWALSDQAAITAAILIHKPGSKVVAPRFYAIGGDLYADRRPITLIAAHQQLLKWWSAARNAERDSEMRIAAEYRRQAEALERAAKDCARQRQAAGWTDVLAPDRTGGDAP